MEAHVRLSEALEALLDPKRSLADTILVSAEVANDEARWSGLPGRVVGRAQLGRALRELGERARVVVTREVDPSLLRAILDQPPALLILTGAGSPELLADLERVGKDPGSRRAMALLGPNAALRRPEPAPARASASEESRPPPIAVAAELDELVRLHEALGAVALAIAPTPPWLHRWLVHPWLAAHDLVGYVPAEALSLAWIDWLRALEERETKQVLIPLGTPEAALEPRSPGLEQAMVAHALERWTGPVYPAPRVLALLHRATANLLGDHERGPDETPQAADLAMWQQARRALPHFAETLAMARPDPALTLRIPTAAFLAQRPLAQLRRRVDVCPPGRDPSGDLDLEARNPEMIARADVVLESATEVLSDQESKVVLRGHGIEVTRQAFATSASGAASFADKIGYPVALKALSPDLRRKREVGAIELDVANAAATKRAYAQIVANVEERAPMARLDGVVVAEMIDPGLDLRCGGLRTRSGDVAIFAQVQHELPTEPLLARSPLDARDALLMAEGVLSAAPLPARRRASDPDARVLARLLLHLDSLFRHTGERLLLVDLDPVRLLTPGDDREYVTLDARIVQRPHLEGL
ncbi:acetate--CoA ligase family protein [Pseudenhygromyxa sp. WMMC2535]|uniref:acetate--CoA ligase family protein n=1 Tax=Pseudenhygromyxa sp. WMMC2535 TaxID=2712867 RepID=UPI00155193C2|nr:acetate--CoA ligase family protein [Pseudenhygromyxa sp. WMMC2535]NVB41904.1 acetate--CoA ligase family protein [Pseudenhygromyxa sp. WMMC2535]